MEFKSRTKEFQCNASTHAVSAMLIHFSSSFFFLFFISLTFLSNFLFLDGRFKKYFIFLLAELRTISLCDSDSDLFMQTYNELHRKSSDSSGHSGAAVSYYSETESQHSVSDRSFYDNVVDDHRHFTKARNFLMPPTGPLRSANVNRSVSFQDNYGQPRKMLMPRANKNIVIRRRDVDDRCEMDSNRSSVSRAGSSASKSNVDSSITCKSDVQSRLRADSCSIDKDNQNGSFYVRALRRMQKLSFFWRKNRKKARSRGRLCLLENFPVKINQLKKSFRRCRFC